REAPDLIVCDVQLPKLDGYGVVTRLKAHPAFRRIPIIAVTALAMIDDRNRMLAAGFDGYISKPIDPETFVPTIEQLLPAAVTRRVFIPEAAESRMPAPVPTAPTHTILVVDNSPVNLQLTEVTLSQQGWLVLTAPSVREAFAILEQGRPDLILSDVHMPETDGFVFLAALRQDETLRSIPFAFLSSTSAHFSSEKEKAFELGAAGFIHRPIEPEELLREVRALLTEGDAQRV
ncbi:MAG TPA: response regulator, partial [Thermoanaerobaculia bacterium]